MPNQDKRVCNNLIKSNEYVNFQNKASLDSFLKALFQLTPTYPYTKTVFFFTPNISSESYSLEHELSNNIGLQ